MYIESKLIRKWPKSRKIGEFILLSAFNSKLLWAMKQWDCNGFVTCPCPSSLMIIREFNKWTDNIRILWAWIWSFEHLNMFHSCFQFWYVSKNPKKKGERMHTKFGVCIGNSVFVNVGKQQQLCLRSSQWILVAHWWNRHINSETAEWSSWFRVFFLHLLWHFVATNRHESCLLFFGFYPINSPKKANIHSADWKHFCIEGLNVVRKQKNHRMHCCNLVVYDDNICGERIAMNRQLCAFGFRSSLSLSFFFIPDDETIYI